MAALPPCFIIFEDSSGGRTQQTERQIDESQNSVTHISKWEEAARQGSMGTALRPRGSWRSRGSLCRLGRVGLAKVHRLPADCLQE